MHMQLCNYAIMFMHNCLAYVKGGRDKQFPRKSSWLGA